MNFLNLTILLILSVLDSFGAERIFYTLNRQNGLSDNVVLQMLQLDDGRMAFETSSAVNIYDGHSIRSVMTDSLSWQRLCGYRGYTHLYLDNSERLWIKDFGKVRCVNLKTLSAIGNPLELIGGQSVEDFFIDDAKCVWTVSGNQIKNISSGVVILGKTDAVLQDLVRIDDTVYLFYNDGKVMSFNVLSGQRIGVSSEYDTVDAEKYSETSLVKYSSEKFYQIRTGSGGSVLLKFDTQTNSCEILFRCGYLLHTLNITKDGKILVSSANGYLVFDNEKTPEILQSLRLADGSELSTGVNTICQDREGGIWLGTYQKGVLYTSELADLFDTSPIDIDVSPILTAIYLQGSPLQIGEKYNGKTILDVDFPYAENLEFDYDQNALSFQFSTMNYIRPRSTVYRYKLNDGPWCQVSAESSGNIVDNNGVMYLSFLNLQPGEYSLSVMATTNPQRWNDTVKTINFRIHAPWWNTPTAWICYILLAMTVIVIGLLHYIKKMKQRIQQRHSKQVLMAANDSDFVNKVREIVERHIADSGFSVEQLASEMCMERTGLYKKLTSLTDESPVALIRNIRLNKAAELLKSGRYKASEVSEMCGFNSPSYFAKCFKEAFGVKPSEYC